MKVYLIAQLANSFYIAGAWREISVEGVRTREKKVRLPKALQTRGVWGHAPAENF